MVGERGFEPPAPASRRQCSTRLSYSPTETPIRPNQSGRPSVRQGGPIGSVIHAGKRRVRAASKEAKAAKTYRLSASEQPVVSQTRAGQSGQYGNAVRGHPICAGWTERSARMRVSQNQSDNLRARECLSDRWHGRTDTHCATQAFDKHQQATVIIASGKKQRFPIACRGQLRKNRKKIECQRMRVVRQPHCTSLHHLR